MLIVIVCTVSLRGYVDSLDCTVKGNGETDDATDAMWVWDRGAGIVCRAGMGGSICIHSVATSLTCSYLMSIATFTLTE